MERHHYFLPFINFLKLPGIILKMASLIKEGTLRGPKSRYEVVKKPPSKTFIIPADEVVQVIAKVCLFLLTTGNFFLFMFMSMHYMAVRLL